MCGPRVSYPLFCIHSSVFTLFKVYCIHSIYSVLYWCHNPLSRDDTKSRTNVHFLVFHLTLADAIICFIAMPMETLWRLFVEVREWGIQFLHYFTDLPIFEGYLILNLFHWNNDNISKVAGGKSNFYKFLTLLRSFQCVFWKEPGVDVNIVFFFIYLNLPVKTVAYKL